MSTNDSQIFESYVPVYDAVPEKWDDAREFLVEQLKKVSEAVNVREIGFFLDEELISGKQFIPGTTNPQEFRTILRKVIDFSPLAVGVNSKPHGINIDSSFRLIDLYGACSDTVTLTGGPINQPNIIYDSANININSPAAFEFAQAVIEYIQEL